MTRGACSCELPSWPRPGDTPCVFDGHRSERFTFSRKFQQQCAKSSKACTCSYLVIFNIKMRGHAWSQYTSICWQPTSNLRASHDFLQHHHGLWTSKLEFLQVQSTSISAHLARGILLREETEPPRSPTSRRSTTINHHHHHHRHRHHPSCHARFPFACLAWVVCLGVSAWSLHSTPFPTGSDGEGMLLCISSFAQPSLTIRP
jgi:hypothetical protein